MAASHEPQPFRFGERRQRLDWQLLGGVEPERLQRERDIDALERVLETLAFGDVTAEDPRVLHGASSELRCARCADAAGAPRRRGRKALPPGAADYRIPAVCAGAL